MSRPQRPAGADILRALAAALAPAAPEVFRALAGALVPYLADLGGVQPADVYTSLDLPRNVSRRAFREACRSGRVTGAHREGRVWVCLRREWHAARTRVEPRAKPALHLVSEPDDRAIADAAIAASDMRPTRRRR